MVITVMIRSVPLSLSVVRSEAIDAAGVSFTGAVFVLMTAGHTLSHSSRR